MPIWTILAKPLWVSPAPRLLQRPPRSAHTLPRLGFQCVALNSRKPHRCCDTGSSPIEETASAFHEILVLFIVGCHTAHFDGFAVIKSPACRSHSDCYSNQLIPSHGSYAELGNPNRLQMPMEHGDHFVRLFQIEWHHPQLGLLLMLVDFVAQICQLGEQGLRAPRLSPFRTRPAIARRYQCGVRRHESGWRLWSIFALQNLALLLHPFRYLFLGGVIHHGNRVVVSVSSVGSSPVSPAVISAGSPS